MTEGGLEANRNELNLGENPSTAHLDFQAEDTVSHKCRSEKRITIA